MPPAHAATSGFGSRPSREARMSVAAERWGGSAGRHLPLRHEVGGDGLADGTVVAGAAAPARPVVARRGSFGKTGSAKRQASGQGGPLMRGPLLRDPIDQVAIPEIPVGGLDRHGHLKRPEQAEQGPEGVLHHQGMAGAPPVAAMATGFPTRAPGSTRWNRCLNGPVELPAASGKRKPPRPRQAGNQGATRTTSLPKLRPLSMPMNASGAFSSPSTTSSR